LHLIFFLLGYEYSYSQFGNNNASQAMAPEMLVGVSYAQSE
jgi:hypothetical protein